MTRPNFNDIQSFDEFKQYYWYHDELKQICKEHGITHTGTKTELNDNIFIDTNHISCHSYTTCSMSYNRI